MVQLDKVIRRTWTEFVRPRLRQILTLTILLASFAAITPEGHPETAPSGWSRLSLFQVYLIVVGLSLLIQVPLPRFLAKRRSTTMGTILAAMFANNLLAFFVVMKFGLTITVETAIIIVLATLTPFLISIGQVWRFRTRTAERLILLCLTAPYSLLSLIYLIGLFRIIHYLVPGTALGLESSLPILLCGADVYANPPAQMAPCTLDLAYRTSVEFWLWFLGQIFSPFFLGAGFAAFGTLLFREKAESTRHPH